MAYEKTTWANGDVITAEKLNHMEDGIVGNNFIIREIYNESLDESECIANTVYDSEVRYDHLYFISSNGNVAELTIRSGFFDCLIADPISDPSIYIYVFTLDQDDETGLKYKITYYSASVQFTKSN